MNKLTIEILDGVGPGLPLIRIMANGEMIGLVHRLRVETVRGELTIIEIEQIHYSPESKVRADRAKTVFDAIPLVKYTALTLEELEVAQRKAAERLDEDKQKAVDEWAAYDKEWQAVCDELIKAHGCAVASETTEEVARRRVARGLPPEVDLSALGITKIVR